jgi:hypothetical protein
VADLPNKPLESPDYGAKKPYSTPRLEVYGDLRKITNTVGNKGSPDGGMPPTFKTH